MLFEIFLEDCLNVMARMPDYSTDLIFTDPPYGYSINSNNDLIHRWELVKGEKPQIQESRPIKNDGPEANILFKKFLLQAKRILKEEGVCCCCCGGGGPDPQFARWSLWMDKVLNFKQMIIIDKGPIGLGWHYRRSYECVLVAQKGNSCKWYDNTNRVENIIRRGDFGIKKIYLSKKQHPTEKCPELAAHFIKLHTQPGDVVLDPFMGHGSTGVAAISLGRRFIGIEIDPKWFQAAKQRILLAEEEVKNSLFSVQLEKKERRKVKDTGEFYK